MSYLSYSFWVSGRHIVCFSDFSAVRNTNYTYPSQSWTPWGYVFACSWPSPVHGACHPAWTLSPSATTPFKAKRTYWTASTATALTKVPCHASSTSCSLTSTRHWTRMKSTWPREWLWSDQPEAREMVPHDHYHWTAVQTNRKTWNPWSLNASCVTWTNTPLRSTSRELIWSMLCPEPESPSATWSANWSETTKKKTHPKRTVASKRVS